jgi:hypothetical protein
LTNGGSYTATHEVRAIYPNWTDSLRLAVVNCGPGITALLLDEETRIPEVMASGLAKIWVHLLFAESNNTP